MKNKVLTMSLIILVCITLVGVVALILVMQLNKGEARKNRQSMKSSKTRSMSRKSRRILAGKQFIRISLKIQTDNKKAAEELAKREFQVKNIVIQELSEMTLAGS